MHNLVAALIVKDEAPVINRCLDSLAPWVEDAYVSDTGSTDNTVEILHERGAVVFHHPWEDFATNRNHVLFNTLARGPRTRVLCGIDADEELVAEPGFKWPDLYSADSWTIECRYGDMRYNRMAIVDPTMWEWRGVIHEALVAVPPGPRVTKHVEGIHIRVGTGGARSRNPNQAEEDLEVLRKAVEKEPANPRYQFYLAQTLKDLKRTAEALVEYSKRAVMPGYPPETAYAQYMVGYMRELRGEDPTLAYAAAVSMDGERAEPLYRMASYFRMTHNRNMAAVVSMAAIRMPRPTHAFLLDDDVYEWRALDEFVSTAFYVPALRASGTAAAEVLLVRDFPETDRARIEANCATYITKESTMAKMNGYFQEAHFRMMEGIWTKVTTGVPLSPQEKQDFGDFVGACNYWLLHQPEFIPIGYKKVGDTFVPNTAPPSDPFADLRWRQANVGSWAAFAPMFFVESNALKAAYPDLENTISLINNYYGPGGFGNVSGRREGDNFIFYNFITQKGEPDVNGAADNFILNQPGNPNHVPPPALNIPPA